MFRYALVNPTLADTHTQEILGGISVYFFKHNLKWQTDAGAHIDKEAGESTTDVVVRSQLQLAF